MLGKALGVVVDFCIEFGVYYFLGIFFWVYYYYLGLKHMFILRYLFLGTDCKRVFIRRNGSIIEDQEIIEMWFKPLYLPFERVELFFAIEDDLYEEEDFFETYDELFSHAILNNLPLPLGESESNNLIISRSTPIFSKSNELDIFFFDITKIRLDWLILNNHSLHYKGGWEWLSVTEYLQTKSERNDIYCNENNYFYDKGIFCSEDYRYTFMQGLVIYNRYFFNFEALRISDYINLKWLKPLKTGKHILPEKIAPMKEREDYAKRLLMYRKRHYFLNFGTGFKKIIKETSLRRQQLDSYVNLIVTKSQIEKANSNLEFKDRLWVSEWLNHTLLKKGRLYHEVSDKKYIFWRFKRTKRSCRNIAIWTGRAKERQPVESQQVYLDKLLAEIEREWHPFVPKYEPYEGPVF